MSRKPNYRGHISRGALDFPRTAIKAKAQRLAGLALQDGLELERLKSREIIRNHKKLNIK